MKHAFQRADNCLFDDVRGVEIPTRRLPDGFDMQRALENAQLYERYQKAIAAPDEVDDATLESMIVELHDHIMFSTVLAPFVHRPVVRRAFISLAPAASWVSVAFLGRTLAAAGDDEAVSAARALFERALVAREVLDGVDALRLPHCLATIACALLIHDANDSKAEETLLALLQDEDVACRESASRGVLTLLRSPRLDVQVWRRFHELAVAYLDKDDDVVFCELALYLVEGYPRRVVSRLDAVMRNNGKTSLYALAQLGRLGREHRSLVVPCLEAYLADCDDPVTRLDIAYRLYSDDSLGEFLVLLRDALKHPAPSVRLRASELLERLDPGAAQHLASEALLDEPDATLIQSLEKIVARGDAPIDAFDDGGPTNR